MCNSVSLQPRLYLPERVSGNGSAPEEQLGDIAAGLLGRLQCLRGELFCIGASLGMLAQHRGSIELNHAAEAARLLAGTELMEHVRDIAMLLPLRGLDFDNTWRPKEM